MAMPSFAANPEAYGLSTSRPNYQKNSRKKPAIAKSGKEVLIDIYDSTLIKRLTIIPGLKLEPASLKGQKEPVFMNAEFGKLYLDHNYQRELKQSNATLIEYAVNHFDYTRVKVPNGIRSAKGNIYLVDGQSTALIYFHHPELRERGYVPCFVSQVSDEQFISRCAAAFVALNECHIPVARADRFTALQTMGDSATLAIANIFKKYGIKPTADKRADNKYAARETRLLSTFQTAYEKHGGEFLDRLCRLLAATAFSPIKRIHVSAVTQILLNDKDGKIDEARLVSAIRSMVDKHAVNEAQLTAARRMWTGPYALAELYKKLYKEGAQAL